MRRGVTLAVLIGLVVAVPAAARQQDETVTVSVGQKVPLDTVFDKETKYTIVMSGLVTMTLKAGNQTQVYDPFYGAQDANCTNSGPSVYLQIKDAAGNLIDFSTADKPPCRKDHRYEFVVNDAYPPAWDLHGKATTYITLQPNPRDWTWGGSFKLQIKPVEDEPATCVRTYVVQPGGARIAAQVHNKELTQKQMAAVLAREEGKYEGWDYTPIGPPTRKVNCAGFVMLKLFGQKRMVDANVDPDSFFRKIVEPFGEGPFTRLAARAGDIAVWRRGGAAQHVGFVESGGVRPTILTKDGTERLYRMNLAYFREERDPLAKAHGRLEFWKLDRRKVKIFVVAGKDCGV